MNAVQSYFKTTKENLKRQDRTRKEACGIIYILEVCKWQCSAAFHLKTIHPSTFHIDNYCDVISMN